MMALVPLAALGSIAALTFVLYNNASSLQPPGGLVGTPAFLALVLHPAGREFFDSFRIARLNRVMLALVLLAAAPLLGSPRGTFGCRARLRTTTP